MLLLDVHVLTQTGGRVSFSQTAADLPTRTEKKDENDLAAGRAKLHVISWDTLMMNITAIIQAMHSGGNVLLFSLESEQWCTGTFPDKHIH